jgi:hypothetical protein
MDLTEVRAGKGHIEGYRGMSRNIEGHGRNEEMF